MSNDEAIKHATDLQKENQDLRQALAKSEARVRQQQTEIEHRVRNLLSIIRAISSRSLERARSLEELAMHQSGRWSALARVEEGLSLSSGAGVDLERLLWNELLAVLSPSEEWRARVEGLPVCLAVKAAERICLAFHELTTNALKFGALASANGCIQVEWRVVSDQLVITWLETGVALVDPSPRHVGFGRDLLENGLAYDLQAETSVKFAPGGLACVVRLPLQDNVVKVDVTQLLHPGFVEL